MAQTLYVRLGAQPADPVNWILYNRDGTPETGPVATIASLGERFADHDDLSIIAILRGECVARRNFPNAPKADAKMMAAGQLLLEDELAEPVEQCHIAILRHEAGAQLYAVRAETLRLFLEPFDEAGLFLSAATVDFDVIASGFNGLTLFVEPERIVGAGANVAFAAEGDLALMAAEAALAKSDAAQIRVYGHFPQADDPDALLYEQAGDADNETLIALASEALEEGRAVNLLQGAFRRRRPVNIDFSRWKRPASMAAGLAAVLFVGVMADGYRADRLATRYREEAVRVHSEAFPDVSGDIRANAASILSSSRGGQAFVSAIPAIAAAVEANEDVFVDRIRYDESRRLFVISVRSASDLAFEAIRNDLSGRGLTVSDTGGYRRSGEAWVGELNVEMS